MTRYILNIFVVPVVLALALPVSVFAEEGHGAANAGATHGTPLVAPMHDAAKTQNDDAVPPWGYEGDADPSVWAELSDEFKACGAGHEQSPIDLDVHNLIPSTFEPVGLHWVPFAPSFLNNGHTLQVNTNGEAGYAELGGVRFELLQFHFHHRSEHSINGAHAPMEVHFVHRSDIGKLLVIGVMVAEGAGNPDIETLWSKMPEVGAEIAIDTLIDPLSMVPRDHASYRYAGSLTTPPCSEIVTWNVFATPVPFSNYQITTFSAQYDNNARPIQPMNRRFVLTDGEH